MTEGACVSSALIKLCLSRSPSPDSVGSSLPEGALRRTPVHLVCQFCRAERGATGGASPSPTGASGMPSKKGNGNTSSTVAYGVGPPSPKGKGNICRAERCAANCRDRRPRLSIWCANFAERKRESILYFAFCICVVPNKNGNRNTSSTTAYGVGPPSPRGKVKSEE